MLTCSHAPWAIWFGYQRAWNWAKRELKDLGVSCAEKPIQVRVTPEATVWCFLIDTGNIYLKWTHAFANDAGITNVLGRTGPWIVKKPLAADLQNQVMLLEDFIMEAGSNQLNREQKKD